MFLFLFNTLAKQQNTVIKSIEKKTPRNKTFDTFVLMEIVRNQSEKTTRGRILFKKNKIDNDKEVRRRENICAHEHANVFKLRSRSEVQRIDRAPHEIRKTCVTVSTLVLHHQHMKGNT